MPELEPPKGWADLSFFGNDFPQLLQELREPFLPPTPQVFAALEACGPEAVRVVILGQDPYPTHGHAHGFAFSVAPDVKPLPKSLVNIYKELQADLDVTRETGDLRAWARQGVLLLNSALTVPPGQPKGHAHLGWDRLVSQVLTRLDDRPRALILWGKDAERTAKAMSHRDHLRIISPHPSPLSAYRGFFGSRPFSRVNDWLIARGEPPIDWGAP